MIGNKTMSTFYEKVRNVMNAYNVIYSSTSILTENMFVKNIYNICDFIILNTISRQRKTAVIFSNFEVHANNVAGRS